VKKVYEYSHLGGSEILKVRYPVIERHIDSVISSIGNLRKTKGSKEKTMRGKRLHSPRELNAAFKKAFHDRGFRELRDTYTVSIPDYEKQIPGAFKQIDFVRDQVLVEVQFGKYAFMF